MNEQLSTLAMDMKVYHSSEKSPEKLLEFMIKYKQNMILQDILNHLQVYVNDSVMFSDIAPSSMQHFSAPVHQMPPLMPNPGVAK